MIGGKLASDVPAKQQTMAKLVYPRLTEFLFKRGEGKVISNFPPLAILQPPGARTPRPGESASTRGAVDKIGTRVCDPQQAVRVIAAFGAIRPIFCRSQCCGSQTRAPMLTSS